MNDRIIIWSLIAVCIIMFCGLAYQSRVIKTQMQELRAITHGYLTLFGQNIQLNNELNRAEQYCAGSK